jgi:hypothetical protein
MKRANMFSLFGLLGAATFLSAAIFLFHSDASFKKLSIFDSACLTQNTYLGPITPIPGNPQLIRVELIVNDDSKAGGAQIQQVKFHETEVPLKPRDINGFRGQGSFQLPPGKYKLIWVINRDKFTWPRTVSHEEIVTLDPRDLWVQITIQGDEASIR